MPSAAPQPLAEVLAAVVSGLRPLASALDVQILERYEAATVRGDPDHTAQIFVNLLTYALRQSMTRPVMISTRVTGEFAVTRIAHGGRGFDADDTRSLLDLTLGIAPRRGTPLASAARLIAANGGQIVAENRTDETGAVVSVWLPLLRPAAAAG